VKRKSRGEKSKRVRAGDKHDEMIDEVIIELLSNQHSKQGGLNALV